MAQAEITETELVELYNPNTTASRLQVLYETYPKGNIVAPEVAMHPNTPADILVALFGRYPDLVLWNSAFPLVLIEEPEFFAKLNKTTLLKLLTNPDLPEYVLEFLLQKDNAEIREATRGHVSLGEATDGWEHEAMKGMGILKHDRRDVAELNILEQSNFVPSWLQEVLISVTINDFLATSSRLTDTSPLNDTDLQKGLGWDVARWSCKVEILRLIEARVDRNLVTPLIYNPHTPSDVLEKLAKRSLGNHHHILRIALHPNTSDILLRTLAQNQTFWVPLAQNPNTPTDILREIATAHEQDKKLFLALLNNPSTPEDIWKPLVEKNLPTIIESLRRNHAEYGYVRIEYSTLVTRLPIAFLLEYYQTSKRHSHSRSMARQFLCIHPETPASVRQNAVRAYYRNNASLLTWFVLLLTETEDMRLDSAVNARWWQIRFAVAINPHAGQMRLEMLSGDANRYVRAAAKARLMESGWRFSP
jgi:hypothetical protein